MKTISTEETTRRGKAMYEAHIRAHVEPKHTGETLVINVETGEYEINADDIQAALRARARFGSNAPLFALRIGSSTAYRLGGYVVSAHHLTSSTP